MEHLSFKEIFASLTYHSVEFTLIKTLLWLGIAAVLIYLFYFLFGKLLFRKKGVSIMKTDIRLQLSMLWSIVAFMVLFSVLVALLFYYMDFSAINWSDYRIYLAFFKNQNLTLFPYLICFITVVLFYYFKNRTFSKNLKTISNG